ncbi:MAG: hypothetical protein OEV08_09600 [Nitrospira sp.]|nr:hypothetical protein [Nitrospira sp.]
MSGHGAKCGLKAFGGHGRISTVMIFSSYAIAIFSAVLCLLPVSEGWTKELLPVEPELSSRVDEHYDHEARLFLILYSLHGDGHIDYVTGRLVQEYARSTYGNPVYQTEAYPLFYWWNHTMYNDPEQDGVNGNERVYQENMEFDISRYKPCTFNGQPC